MTSRGLRADPASSANGVGTFPYAPCFSEDRCDLYGCRRRVSFSISFLKALFRMATSCFGAARTCCSRSSKKGSTALTPRWGQSNRWIVVQSFGTFLSVPHHVVSRIFSQ